MTTSTTNPASSMTSTSTTSTGILLQNRYRVLNRLGKGGMGSVYVAEDLRLAGKRVAVKELSMDAVAPEERAEALQDFQKEAQILAQLDHPGLTKVTDFFSEAGRWYLTMEYVPGKTLEAVAEQRGGRIDEDEVIRWTHQICHVLEYLHRSTPPIIFRDLKPGNVMLMPDGRIKLIDFGIARFFKQGKSSDTRNMGTPGFAAPEQYGKGQTDARSDIYSLGVMLHHLLTGYDPSQSPFMLPAPRTLNAAIDPRLEEIILRCTQIAPDQRYPDVAAFRQGLAALGKRGLSGKLNGAGAAQPFARGQSSQTARPAVPTSPDAPSNVSAQLRGGHVTVSWQPPKNDGGAPITGYTVIANPGGRTVTAARYATDARFIDLEQSKTYTFSVKAKNAAGDSGWVNAANTITLPALTTAQPSTQTKAKQTGRRMRRARFPLIAAAIAFSLVAHVLVQGPLSDVQLLAADLMRDASLGFVPLSGALTLVTWTARSLLFVLPYYLTLQPGVTMLTFVAGQIFGGIVPGVLSFVAAEAIFASSGYRARTLGSGIFAGFAIIMALYFTGDAPSSLFWAAVGSALGGAIGAAIGWFVGLFTRVGR